MKSWVVMLVVLLVVLHQDFWWRGDDSTLVFGVLPISLFYHVMLSISASVVWGLACRFAWPAGLDVADHDAGMSSGRGGH